MQTLIGGIDREMPLPFSFTILTKEARGLGKYFFTIYKDNSYDIEYQNPNKEFKLITKKPILETSTNNSRARSAKLRVAERIL